ncbi:TspO/MBR family protein [Sphingomonas sp.]|jgi:tryptophan-rich sensory protein|uniref:TspO/MBR family protein n=1 Tax=Sphingomonas sp. TaxID=28214 RepID=UPI002D8012D6|nr:TspO/MBR family protein [Sphingomonas sp.]HEU0045771.1 TspO/MBR family protein [Sphingomonas sp.]
MTDEPRTGGHVSLHGIGRESGVTSAALRGQGLSPWAAAGTIAAVMGASGLVAMRNSPDPLHPRIRRWYKRLDKPSFTPPDPVFGAVWPVLETGLAIGGYRLLRRPSSPPRDTAMALWFVTAAMVGGWTQIFFGERKLGASAVASAAMLASGTGYVAAAARVDRPAAALAVPFVAWLGFATLLAEQVWERNAGPAKRAASS